MSKTPNAKDMLPSRAPSNTTTASRRRPGDALGGRSPATNASTRASCGAVMDFGQGYLSRARPGLVTRHTRTRFSPPAAAETYDGPMYVVLLLVVFALAG